MVRRPNQFFFFDRFQFGKANSQGTEKLAKMYWYGTLEVCRLNWPLYRVAPNFYRSLILRFGKFLSSAGTNFCDWERLVFSLEINFSGSRQNRKKKPIFYVLFVCLLLFFFSSSCIQNTVKPKCSSKKRYSVPVYDKYILPCCG